MTQSISNRPYSCFHTYLFQGEPLFLVQVNSSRVALNSRLHSRLEALVLHVEYPPRDRTAHDHPATNSQIAQTDCRFIQGGVGLDEERRDRRCDSIIHRAAERADNKQDVDIGVEKERKWVARNLDRRWGARGNGRRIPSNNGDNRPVDKEDVRAAAFVYGLQCLWLEPIQYKKIRVIPST